MTDLDGRAPATVIELAVDGRRYALQLPDAATDYIQKKIATEGQPYEREMLDDMRSRLAAGDLAIDVGANVGNHTLYLAAVAGCDVEAFEPNRRLCDAMRASAALNALSEHVRVHDVGVGRGAARAQFEKTLPDNLGAQRLELGEGEIEVVALDAMTFDRPVKLLKIDVEGMEMDVLHGARALIERDRPMLYIECIGEPQLREVSRWADACGYSYWDTFNATPTHLFLPNERIRVESRLSRLQLMAWREQTRSVQLVAAVRQKLTRAYDNEREAKQLGADLARDLALRSAELDQVTQRLDAEQKNAQARTAADLTTTLALKDDLAAARAEGAALGTRLEAATSELERTRRDLAAAGAQRDELAAQLDAVRRTLLATQQRVATMQAEIDALSALRVQHRQVCSERDRLDTDLRSSRAEAAALHSAAGEAASRMAALERAKGAERGQLSGRIAHLEHQLAELQDDRRKLQRALELKAGRLDATEKRFDRVKASSSYLVGAALVGGTRSLPAALGLPARLWQIFRSADQRREARKAMPVVPVLPTAPARVPPTAKALAAAPLPAPQPRPVAGAGAPGLRELAVLADLRIACIFDEFTFHSFAPECELLQLRPDDWQRQVEAFAPDIVFIESAWRGVDDSWQKKVSDISGELLALIEWALRAGVPSAFWCKEDPVHFARFLPVARLVDHVFTTDIDCIPKYKDALKHERVHLLPFAAQPALHNPVETVLRADAFCFAGSYYPHYPDRQVDFRALVGVGRALKSVEIYDRNADRPLPHSFVFPDEYRAEIRGTLPYTEMDRAYKGCRYGITVNTIKQSQTMFARRAFELMACNTVVVSNFSKGLRLFFGDLVVASDDASELEHRLAPLCADDTLYRRHRLRALRCVLSQHTYEHRLAYVASRLAGRRIEAALPRLALFGEPTTAADALRLAEALARQSLPRAALWLAGAAAAAAAGCEGVRVFADRAAVLAALGELDWVAPVCAADYHGAHYLGDMALATRFARGDGVTKAARFVADADGSPQLEGDGAQYRPAASAALRCSLVRVEALRPLLADPALDLATAALTSDSLLGLDEFSYCRDAASAGAAFDAAPVDVAAEMRPGADFAGQVLRIAEDITVPAGSSGTDDGPLVMAAADWRKCFPKEVDARLEASSGDDGRVVLRSALGPSDHQYIYLTRRFTPAELKAERESFFQLEADARLDLRTVIVFHDAADKKISHVMHTVGARYALHVPEGTISVRLALRIQGPGTAALGALTLGETRGLPQQVIPTARHLIVANQYPSYDDLYRYGFVHARVRAYARAGVPVEVLRLSGDPKVGFREFEDVNVVEADTDWLERCLAGGHYASVLIHIVDQRMWNVVRKHLDRVRVVIWAHGAEIQPWWRRAMNFATDPLRDQARRNSDARLDMWREILCLKHPNLRVVFISHKQAGEALSDLRLRPAMASGVEVISNFIDGDLFRYVPKPPEQRHRILSIRPFASRVYANDLSVEAIRLLADKPFFHELQFRIVGDGALFDQTVAPIRHLPNVEVTRAFLTQRQIAALHRDYGVFLVPSRMDSQGVSRDEAMASGLVPVTTRIAAIPEFVDEACGFLADPEDAVGLARAIEALHADPARFQSMSAAAAQRVRMQSGQVSTIGRELALVEGRTAPGVGTVLERLATQEAGLARIALYGDVNLNVMDGSAVWAASLAETLGGMPGVRVSLLLKARIHRTPVIARLLDLAPAVQLVEPRIPEKEGLSPAQAVAELVALDAELDLRAFVLRGLDLCVEAARTASLQGRIWAYLTDIPQSADQMTAEARDRIGTVVAHSEFILCQTPQMQAFFVEVFPQARGRTRILPPMIPPAPPIAAAPPATPFRLCYAGKFAPRWGILELFDAFAALRAQQPDAELHVFGDKIHKAPERPGYRETVAEKLSATPGLLWHGAVNRDELMRRLPTMHACWAFRDPAFERETLELSTKALEYASLGIPTLLARSPVYESVFGRDYPLLAASEDEALDLLLRLSAEPAFRANVAEMLTATATRYTFAAVRADIVAQGLLPSRGGAAPSSVRPAEALALSAP